MRTSATAGVFGTRHSSPIARRWTVIALFTVLAGCVVGDDYVRPQVETPPQWRIDYPQSADIANTKWWEAFGDPKLNQLIETALRENRDLVVAAARVEQFMGTLRTTRSRFYPQIDYGIDASRNRLSRVGQPPLAPGADPYYTLYQGALGASWQIDLFGRVQRQTEAANAQLLATEQGRRGVVLSVVTSVATSYIALRALDRQLEIAKSTADNYAGSLRIMDLRFKGGVASQVEVSQVESQYQQARAAIPAIEQQIAAQENLISILIGRNPGPISRGKPILKLGTPGVPADLPSTLLERRPDILQAEQNLVAANANVGVAKSLYYPTISLTGLLGSISTAFGDFLTGASRAGYVAAGVAGPIATFGGIEGQVESAEAAQRAALAIYQQTILNAFRETNDALVGAQKTRETAEAQVKRAASLREYARLARVRFDNGAASYLEVLYAENERFAAELESVRANSNRFTALVDVYKAVGGGWVDEAAKAAPQATARQP